MDGRMRGKDEGEDNDAQDEGTVEDGGFVIVQHAGFAFSGFGEQAFHHKDTIVNANAVDEGGNDNVDQVELEAQEGHVALHHVPAHEHGEEGYEGGPDVPET